MAERDFLTVTEAARELGVSVRTVQERIHRGLMHAERVNPRLLLIPRAEVQRLRPGKLTPGRKSSRHQSVLD